MTRYALLSVALLAAVPVTAQPLPQSGTAAQSAPDAASPKLQNLIQNCDAHKFETTVVSTVDGKPHDSKVKLCGNEGQSDADWIRTLRDAVDKLSTNTEMSAATRDQIIGAIKLEIARLNGQVTTDLSATGGLPTGRSSRPSQSLSSDYSVLPPLTGAPAPPPHLLTPAPGSGEGKSETATNMGPSTPSIPEPAASALIDNAPAAAPPSAPPPAPKVAVAAKPKLVFECIGSDFPGGGPCVSLSRDTILSVKAGEPVSDDLGLRFIRRGEARAEISLGSMNKGQSIRLQIPNEVCSGVVSTEINIDVTRSGQVVDRLGPYLLRC
jgi:hypothetical protein